MANERLGLFLVCDGIGGRASGEIAAAEAVAIIEAQVGDALAGTREDDGAAVDPVAHVGAIVRAAMQCASRTIFAQGRADPSCAGMGTTASVVLVVGDLAVIGHVGDSRVYHARGDSVRQLTEDHTLHNWQVQQGALAPEPTRGRKSPITRALGLREVVEVDVYTWRLRPGDRLLLCTDGLHEYFEGAATLTRLLQLDVREAATAAIRHAHRCGGKDNVTALFIEVLGEPAQPAV